MTVGQILNLNTGAISPQYCIVYHDSGSPEPSDGYSPPSYCMMTTTVHATITARVVRAEEVSCNDHFIGPSKLTFSFTHPLALTRDRDTVSDVIDLRK